MTKKNDNVENEVPLEDTKVIMQPNSGPKSAPNPDDVPVIRNGSDPFKDQKNKKGKKAAKDGDGVSVDGDGNEKGAAK